jgi:hypothetical protein
VSKGIIGEKGRRGEEKKKKKKEGWSLGCIAKATIAAFSFLFPYFLRHFI